MKSLRICYLKYLVYNKIKIILIGASDLLSITENDAKLAFELIDADNSNTIAYAEFMNYILYDQDEMKLILYKIRLEVKFFLSKRDDYPYKYNII